MGMLPQNRGAPVLKIAIFGLGYVGCTAAGCLASEGHDVIGIDVSAAKVAIVNAGRSPICEPGLDDLIARARAEGRIAASVDVADHLDTSDSHCLRRHARQGRWRS